MNKMKRIFSFVLVFAMLVGSFSSFSAVAFAEEVKETVVEEVKETKEGTDVLTKIPSDVIGTEYEKAVTRLVAFGVITGYPDGSYKPEENINRVQFAKVVVVALGLGDAVPAAEHKATGFSDVQQGYWGAGYINVATGQGLLKGYPDGTFKPAQQVSYAEALTILVRALGYKDEFLQGRWPGSHVAKAAEVGITADVKMPADATNGAKRGNVAKLVNNALDAKVIKVDTYKPNTSEIDYYETDIPLLKDRLEISKYENTRVIGDKIIDDGLDKDEIRIRFLEDVEKYDKRDRYTRGEIVKRAYSAGDKDTYRHNDFVEPREIIGEEVTTYINDNDKVIFVERENDDKAMFDYVEDLEKGKALNLVAFDRDYKFETEAKKDSRRDDSANIFVFNEKDDRYDEVYVEDINEVTKELDKLVGRMGKFVVKNNRIVYAEIMDPSEADNYMVVMENKDGQLKGIHAETNEFKLDLRDDQDYDYSLVYNTKGEKVSVKDIKKGNVLYVEKLSYDGDDVAHVVVVQDNEVEGELGRVKEDRIELAGKEMKVVKYQKDGKDVERTYVTSYAVSDIDEVRRWNEDQTWEDDMEDAFKETVVAYKDAVGRIAFLTTEGVGEAGYKYGIITRTYTDNDRIRIFTTIDGKEGKDQVFKADKERDISSPRLLDGEGLEQKDVEANRDKAKVGMAVKFRLNADGEIAKDKLFVMPTANMMAMTDDFGKDMIKATEADDFDKDYKNKSGQTYAVNSDSIVLIDAPKVGTKLVKDTSNLDGAEMNATDKKIDIDDFTIGTWKDIKEDNHDAGIRFYIFPKNNRANEVDGLVFIGKDGANTGADEEAIYVLDTWKKGDSRFVEYVKYPENKKETREIDDEDKLVIDSRNVYKETAYIGKEKSNGKIAIYGKVSDKTLYVAGKSDGAGFEDFDLYRNVVIKEVNGNYITLVDDSALKGARRELLTTGSLIYDEKTSKSSVKKGMKVDIISDGIRARVIGIEDTGLDVDEKPSKPEETTDGAVTYINAAGTRFEVDGVVYTINEDTKLVDEDGTTVAVGINDIKNPLKGAFAVGDKVTVKDNVITRTVSATETATADAEAAAAFDTAVTELSLISEIKGMDAEALATAKEEVEAARDIYEDLSDDAKELVTQLENLVAKEEAIEAREAELAQAEADAMVNTIVLQNLGTRYSVDVDFVTPLKVNQLSSLKVSIYENTNLLATNELIDTTLWNIQEITSPFYTSGSNTDTAWNLGTVLAGNANKVVIEFVKEGVTYKVTK